MTGPAPELIWPDSLIQPQRPPALIYLDLNHWIGIAKANVGRATGGGYMALLDAARTAKREAAAVFVLSDSLFIEMSNIADPRQRRDLADVMEELTSFTIMLSRPSVTRLELQAAIEGIVGPGPERYAPLDLLSTRLAHGFGKRGNLLIKDSEGNDVTMNLRAEMGAEKFDAMMAAMERDANRMLLRGPQDDELDDLRLRGYKPEAHRQVTQNRLDQELELVAILNREPKNWRKGRLRDVVGGRELVIELNDMIVMALMPRGLSVDNLVEGDRAKIRSFARCMPGCEVAIELKTQYHRDPSKRWMVNDIYDIDALAVAVPYCDAVFTDAAARSILVKAGFEGRMKTALPRTPDELVGILAALPRSR
ncbi:hypothetical protein C8E86_2787 [Catellatospora citrea]|nr:hypothetical protein C8E86_2787 [Catellatospora citrea]